MLHIAIPDWEVLSERNDKNARFVAFRVHINGLFHANVRYSYLYNLHESIKERWKHRHRIPEFPSKSMFRNCEPRFLEARRAQLTLYFQELLLLPDVIRSPAVEKSFLDFQVESYRAASSTAAVDVFLANGERLPVRCHVTNSADDIIRLVGETLGIDASFHSNFGLFLAVERAKQHLLERGGNDSEPVSPIDSRSDDTTPDFVCVRLLRSFESVYISQQLMNQRAASHGLHYRLTLRRMLCEPRAELPMLSDAGALRVLYAQAFNDFRLGRLTVAEDVRETLEQLIEAKQCEKFVRLCAQQTGYGWEWLATGWIVQQDDDQNGRVRCSIRIGRRQIGLTVNDDQSDRPVENCYRATRIRVWRLRYSDGQRPDYFEFEHLVLDGNEEQSKREETFEWIRIQTEHAVLLCQLMQWTGAEILREHRAAQMERDAQEERRLFGDLDSSTFDSTPSTYHSWHASTLSTSRVGDTGGGGARASTLSSQQQQQPAPPSPIEKIVFYPAASSTANKTTSNGSSVGLQSVVRFDLTATTADDPLTSPTGTGREQEPVGYTSLHDMTPQIMAPFPSSSLSS